MISLRKTMSGYPQMELQSENLQSPKKRSISKSASKKQDSATKTFSIELQLRHLFDVSREVTKGVDSSEKSRICTSISKSQQRLKARKVGSENLNTAQKLHLPPTMPERKSLIQEFNQSEDMNRKGGLHKHQEARFAQKMDHNMDSLLDSENQSTVRFLS